MKTVADRGVAAGRPSAPSPVRRGRAVARPLRGIVAAGGAGLALAFISPVHASGTASFWIATVALLVGLSSLWSP